MLGNVCIPLPMEAIAFKTVIFTLENITQYPVDFVTVQWLVPSLK